MDSSSRSVSPTAPTTNWVTLLAMRWRRLSLRIFCAQSSICSSSSTKIFLGARAARRALVGASRLTEMRSASCIDR